jgi:hypothetical protein
MAWARGTHATEDLDRLRRLADEGRDLATGEAAPDWQGLCRMCGKRKPQDGRYVCSVCAAKTRRAAKAAVPGKKEVDAMGEHERLDLAQVSGAAAGGQAADGVPAARPMPPAADPVGRRARGAARPGEPECPDCGAKVCLPGKRCRKCAGLARRGKPRGRPTSAPGRRGAAGTPSGPSGRAEAATGRQGGRFKCASGCGEAVPRDGAYCPGCRAIADGQVGDRRGGGGRRPAVEPPPHRPAEKGRIERAAKRPKAGAARRPAAAAAADDSPTDPISDRLGETVRRIAADLADEVLGSVVESPWVYSLARDAMAAGGKASAEVARFRAMEALVLLAAAECSD